MMVPEAIRVIMADDHPPILDGMTAYLTTDSQLQVVAVARSFPDLMQVLRTTRADVLVLDVGGMGGSPFPVLDRIKREYPQLAVIVFSSSVDLVRNMLKAGVKGYVVKEDLSTQLVSAIHAVRAGKQFLSRVAQEYVARTTALAPQINLAPQEVNVLRLLAQGSSTKEIADHLGIDVRTVHGYLLKIRKKTGRHERTELAAWYHRVYGSSAI